MWPCVHGESRLLCFIERNGRNVFLFRSGCVCWARASDDASLAKSEEVQLQLRRLTPRQQPPKKSELSLASGDGSLGSMLLLLETPAGYALFSLKNKKLLKADPESIYDSFKTSADAQRQVSLTAFHKFEDTKAAMEACTELTEGTVGKGLKKFLKKSIVDAGLTENLAVLDKSLGVNINKKLGLEVSVLSENLKEIMRGVRLHLTELIEGLDEQEVKAMSLGLAHTLSRFKLKFSPDKVDTMIIQAVGLLDDLDKELNNFAMRLREWYGWHFPEMGKIVTENLAYAKVVRLMGLKTRAKDTDLSEIGVPDEIAAEVRSAAETSMADIAVHLAPPDDLEQGPAEVKLREETQRRQQLDLEVARLSVRSQVLKENAEKHEEQMRAMVEEKNELKRRYDELRTHSERLQEEKTSLKQKCDDQYEQLEEWMQETATGSSRAEESAEESSVLSSEEASNAKDQDFRLTRLSSAYATESRQNHLPEPVDPTLHTGVDLLGKTAEQHRMEDEESLQETAVGSSPEEDCPQLADYAFFSLRAPDVAPVLEPAEESSVLSSEEVMHPADQDCALVGSTAEPCSHNLRRYADFSVSAALDGMRVCTTPRCNLFPCFFQSISLQYGTEITDEDLGNIKTLSERVIELTEYRASLSEYLKLRMNAIAPNLTYMVGELVGARLISQAGSLMSLAKHPSSTVQILGAEKALFRALKTKKSTPKYGLIYHASLVGQSAPALKGKISRVLAAKLSLCCRVDALGDQVEPTLGEEFKEYVEKRLATLEEGGMKSQNKGISRPNVGKHQKRPAVKGSATAYSAEDDVVEEAPKRKKKAAEEEEAEPAPKKKKKKAADAEEAEAEEEEAPRKKKKRAA
ncbi:putative nucleolar protein 5-1 [Symbiodinium microadriaticum]|uniref:Putative nucleolar protein 5-1 n=1 Tax=Symbiodinium microadriaticum TaxID=2951 RepID=A0A1Q9DG50_SYMMI|nr:putative nucleolar protein 5-1 [Symbiodinium microadriaticum]